MRLLHIRLLVVLALLAATAIPAHAASLTLVKSVTEATFTLPADTLHYSYLVTNNGLPPLPGPVTVTDDHATVTCPSVNTVGNLDGNLDPGESIFCSATYIV